MALPTDIAQWVAQNGACLEGVERLAEYASMAAAWDGSTNGSMVLYMIRTEGLYTDEVRAVVATHRTALLSVKAAATEKLYEGGARLQDLDEPYGEALSALAAELKALVPNPFS